MPVTYHWYDEAQTIIQCRMSENWTLEELSEGRLGLNELVKDIATRFDIITDLSESTYTPPVGALWDWKQAVMVRDMLFSNWGLTVFINTNPVFDAYFEEGMQTSAAIQRHTRIASNLLEAIKIIEADRASMGSG